MLIAQITDLHVRPAGELAYGFVDTSAMLAAAVAALAALRPRPDVVLVTGDLTDRGLSEEYALLREILAPLRMPVHVVPGNRDRRENLRVAFRDHDYLPQTGDFLHYAVEDHPVRLIGLDTVTPGESGGLLGPFRLASLEGRLAEAAPERPTVIFMHHPPFEVGVPELDRINCLGGQEMGAIVARHPNVERILCGHFHRPVQRRWCGTVGSIAPSTAYQNVLDLRPARSASAWSRPASWSTSGAGKPASSATRSRSATSAGPTITAASPTPAEPSRPPEIRPSRLPARRAIA